MSTCAVQNSVRAPSLPVLTRSEIKSSESIMTHTCNPYFLSVKHTCKSPNPLWISPSGLLCALSRPTGLMHEGLHSDSTQIRHLPSHHSGKPRLPMNHAAIHLNKTTIQRYTYSLPPKQIQCAQEPYSNNPWTRQRYRDVRPSCNRSSLYLSTAALHEHSM